MAWAVILLPPRDLFHRGCDMDARRDGSVDMALPPQTSNGFDRIWFSACLWHSVPSVQARNGASTNYGVSAISPDLD